MGQPMNSLQEILKSYYKSTYEWLSLAKKMVKAGAAATRFITYATILPYLAAIAFVDRCVWVELLSQDWISFHNIW